MQTPAMVSGARFGELIAEFEDANVKTEDNGLMCSTCDSVVMTVPASISIHNSPIGVCAGFGEVEPVQIPYCPKCEEVPRQSGCVHP